MTTVTVKVIERLTGKVVELVECKSSREADRVERGMNININYHDYYTVQEVL